MSLNAFWYLQPRHYSSCRRPREYVHLDGTPQGKTGIARYLASPVTHVAAVSVAFLATAHYLLDPSISQHPSSLYNSVLDAVLIFSRATRAIQRHRKFDEDFVIDISGNGGNDRDLSLTFAQYYRALGKRGLGYIEFGTMMAASIVYLELAGQFNPRANDPFATPVLLEAGRSLGTFLREAGFSAIIGYLPIIPMGYVAARKLKNGDWSIATPTVAREPLENEIPAGAKKQLSRLMAG